MSIKERILHAVLFEFGALLVSSIVVKLVSHNADNQTAFTVAIVLACMAICLNFLFNFMFDKIFTGKRQERGWAFRLFHTTAFEAFLLLFTVPMVAYIVNLTWLQAFVADMAMTFAVMVYAFVFNWIYDHTRLKFVVPESAN